MLDPVEAMQFYRATTSGRNRPTILLCARGNGDEIDVIAKFSFQCDRKCGSLISEAISAILAADLGLPVPEPVLVHLHDDFLDAVELCDRSTAYQLRSSIPIGFGSKKLPPGFSLVQQSTTLKGQLRNQAAEIFAFDALIHNVDRLVGNPNCLFDGSNFAIIDHDLTFFHRGSLGWKPPWEIGSLEKIRGARDPHIFFQKLSGEVYDFERLEAAWGRITDDRINEYASIIPQEWQSAAHEDLDESLKLITGIRENISESLSEVKRILL